MSPRAQDSLGQIGGLIRSARLTQFPEWRFQDESRNGGVINNNCLENNSDGSGAAERSDYPSSESSLQAWALLPDVWPPTLQCATTWMLFVSPSVVASLCFRNQESLGILTRSVQATRFISQPQTQRHS
jgi:hypothetical protein